MTERDQDSLERIFRELCGLLNLNNEVEVAAWKQYLDTKQNYVLAGDQKDWMCCSIYTACQTKLPTISTEKVIVGNCISLAKLITICEMDVYTFFKKMSTWCDVATLNPSISKKVQMIQRSFSVTEMIYKKFGAIFKKLFQCPEIEDTKTPQKSSKKSKPLPCTPQKLFEFCWSLFVTVKGDNPEEGVDLVTSVNLLYCCIDLIYANAVYDKRNDLLNPDFSGFPKDPIAEDMMPICIIDKLCSDNDKETTDVMHVKAYKWDPIVKKFFNRNVLFGNDNNLMQLISIENFENNFKRINELYEQYILSCGEFDERIFLKHFKIGSKFYGCSPDEIDKSVVPNDPNYRRRLLVEETPLTGQRLLGNQGDYRMTPLTCVEDNVRKLRTLKNSSRDPQPSLYKLLVTQGPDEIVLELRNRLDKMMVIFCKEYQSNAMEHFKLAEALYYQFLESMIRTEMQKNINFGIYIKDELLNKSLIVLCMEIVLYGFSRQKDFPRILDIFELDPFYFYKLIEISIRNNMSLLTRDIIKHLTSIEEQCLDSLAWRRGSVIWTIISEYKEPLPQYQDVDSNGNLVATPVKNSNGQNGNAKSFRSLKLFFRKFYQLANVRIKHTCSLLQLNDEEMLKEVWTIFENAIINHVSLMQDRHLDQIWMCCIYVLCKIRPDDFKFNFADIMRYYRNQPQAGSHIYRSVFIEYIEDGSDHTEQQVPQSQEPSNPADLRGSGVVHGKESRGDIIYFYNKVFVPKLQDFALKFGTGAPRAGLLLSPMPPDRIQNVSPKKISLYHDVYIAPFSKHDTKILGKTFTFVFDKSPSKDLQKLNSMIHQTSLNKTKVSKRLNIDDNVVDNAKKLPKIQALISDRQNLN